MRSSVPVSVVVCAYQEGDRVAETIRSVASASVRPRQLVLVDDGSTDGGCERTWPPWVRTLRGDHVGVAAARNRGAQAADQPVLVFLDAHCAVDDRWLTPLVTALDRTPDALVGPAVRDASDSRFVGCGAELVDALLTYRWRPATGPAPGEVGLLPGGCLAVVRDRFLTEGGFAAFSGFGLEDVELALRWWRAGRPSLGIPEAVVTHRFRTLPPYRPEQQPWLQNILRTGLAHLPGPHLRATVLACARFSTFPGAIATVLAEPWTAAQQRLLTTELRPIADYLDQWAPRAFTS
ncbi:glycosyltransferase family 2 protein [Kitasatospora sp. NPDC048286]|uniref:glycosyltransferase family 2 protein n=1 Tax=Kitasatospora sp. NPDC048286 TaxID=3364047 RepID=UPI00371C3787